jgi:hypothetical protein
VADFGNLFGWQANERQTFAEAGRLPTGGKNAAAGDQAAS